MTNTFDRNILQRLGLCGFAKLISACLFLALAACASVPSQEMSDARRAFDAANQVQASQVAPSAMRRARVALDDANTALREGRYDRARVFAQTARGEAIAARQLSHELTAVARAIEIARKQGQPWQGAEQLVQQALQVSANGDMSRAMAMAKRAATLVP